MGLAWNVLVGEFFVGRESWGQIFILDLRWRPGLPVSVLPFLLVLCKKKDKAGWAMGSNLYS
jgi:hypothetical protein